MCPEYQRQMNNCDASSAWRFAEAYLGLQDWRDPQIICPVRLQYSLFVKM
jgi:hypothetical protein